MHSDHIVVGMHYAYFMGDPTNGLQDNTLNHLNPSTWPMRPAFDPTKNNWNVHRWDWLQKFYRQAYPDAPMFRAVNTEGGPDSLDDDNSRKYIGRQLEGGWRRQAQYWQDVYHWTPDQALKICMDYINATLPDFVEGNLFFCYGTNNDPKWHYYNVEFLTDFIKAMEQANTFHASSPAAPPPVPAPVPHVQSQFYAVQASGDKMIPVYSAPLETRIAGYLTNWEIVESTNVPNGGMLDVKTDKLCGYIRTDNIILARFAPLPVDEIVKLRKLLK
jgi:hypothetical protein